MDGLTAILQGYGRDLRSLPGDVAAALTTDAVAVRAAKLLDGTKLPAHTIRAALERITADELREALNCLRIPAERAAGLAYLRWCAGGRGPIPHRKDKL